MVSIALYLLIGFIGASILIAFARKSRRPKLVFGAGLIIASLIYVGFAITAADRSTWLLAELAGVVAFGAFAVLGIRGSAWWLVAGWLLHPIWDVAIHYFGAGAAFTPEWYPIVCVSFDLLVAAYIAFACTKRKNR